MEYPGPIPFDSGNSQSRIPLDYCHKQRLTKFRISDSQSEWLLHPVDPLRDHRRPEQHRSSTIVAQARINLSPGQDRVETTMLVVAHVVDRRPTLLGLEADLFLVHPKAVAVKQVFAGGECIHGQVHLLTTL